VQAALSSADPATRAACLGAMPAFLRAAAAALDGPRLRARPAGGGFALVEHLRHLADLEREGYGVRIARLLAERCPRLPDFDGARIARERRYLDADAALALREFEAARAQNLARLAAAGPDELAREGVQEGVGRLALGDVPRAMAAHDEEHRREIEALLAELAERDG
jgi:hypothetical protein